MTLGSTPAPATTSTDNILGQDMNLIDASPHQGVKLVLTGDRTEHYVATKQTFIEFIQGWIELFSAGNLDTL